MAKQPEVIRDKACMRSWSRLHRWKGKTLALVPTMGFLDQGHLSLIREAKAHSDVVIVSIYVNPGQFAPFEDLATYPSDLVGDLQKLADAEVDAAFCPLNLYDCGSDGVPWEAGSGGSNERMVISCLKARDGGGRGGHETWIRAERLEKGLCGKSRPVFFRGVAMVVAKLFNIVEPDVALFRKKDY